MKNIPMQALLVKSAPRNTVVALLLAATLLVGLAGPAMASNRHAAATTTASASSTIKTSAASATQSLAESRALKWVMDRVAITKVELSPGAKRFVNFVLKLTLPTICPLVASAADPAFQDLVRTQCNGIASSPDPWEALKGLAPLLCAYGAFIFPKYTDLLTVGCGLLL
jgi:hypothetical protein